MKFSRICGGLVIVLILVLNPLNVRGQFTSYFVTPESENPRTFYGGYAIGANFCQVDGDMRSGYNKVGLNAGAMVYARVTDQFGAHLEIIYSQKGSKSRYLTETMAGTAVEGYDIKLNYIEIPVLLHYFSNKRLHYGLGASYSRLLSWKEEAFTNAGVNLHPEVNYFRKNDWCILGEVSYEFYKGWFLSFRYHRSVMSIRDRERIPQGYGGGISYGQYNNYCSLRLMHLIK